MHWERDFSAASEAGMWDGAGSVDSKVPKPLSHGALASRGAREVPGIRRVVVVLDSLI